MFDDSVTNKARLREVERSARQLADSVGKLFEDGVKGLSHHHDNHEKKLEAWREEAHKKWDSSRRIAMEKGEEIDAYARENVWKTVGIAAVVGAVVGSLLMKRRR